VYPEGTITKDPTGWPMRGKTGAARIALETGCPVVPIGQWGAQEILPAYSFRYHAFPRRTARYKVGDPVDLSDLVGQPITNELLQEATERIMAAITALVAELRGEEPPTVRFDPRAAGVRQIGNPKKPARGTTSSDAGKRWLA
jgi:1-acyl-sn-glycerol-3-phosphate acyltransferase